METKKQTFAKGVLILTLSQILIKILGFVYRAVITNFPGFGDEGNGYYSAAYRVYVLIFAVATTGIPGAISKLVSEKMALRR